ncbi:Nse4 C-terminal-domain-containing protein [Pterulicium gracile]|uniref:Non-structural maintenance of chromosomes element 4 n=1 Tax=Pterulicium gracile TaxID=1884261 RepID=A0A5C3R258_9AGAR|nr:Nse4 C-terminal-domain-containing protein [Pterula gracilis]
MSLPYDPDQNIEEKRDVRKQYRKIQTDIENANSKEHSIADLSTTIKAVDNLFVKLVKGPQEATLDSAVLLHASAISSEKARSMKSSSGAFDVDDFISRLINFMGGNKSMDSELPDESDASEDGGMPLDWERLGRKALAKSRRVPTMDFMLGPLSIEVKKRAITKRARQEKNTGEASKPQEIREEDIARSENETSNNVRSLEKILEEMDDERVNLFRFVVNPNNFAQSVENIFYLSFLIRDGKVALELSDSGEPELFLCEPPTDEDRMRNNLRKRQIVMEFDMATWQRSIEVFDIRQPMIPERSAANTKIGDKWYG